MSDRRTNGWMDSSQPSNHSLYFSLISFSLTNSLPRGYILKMQLEEFQEGGQQFGTFLHTETAKRTEGGSRRDDAALKIIHTCLI